VLPPSVADAEVGPVNVFRTFALVAEKNPLKKPVNFIVDA
jgi:hypothetical protein